MFLTFCSQFSGKMIDFVKKSCLKNKLTQLIIPCSVFTILLLLYNVYNCHDYLIGMSAMASYFYMGMDLWTRTDVILWIVFITILNFVYFINHT